MLAILLCALVGIGGAASSWACVPSGGGGGREAKELTIDPTVVRPGEQVNVSVPSAAVTTPIELRLNASDGPLLGSIPVPGEGAASRTTVSATLTIPGDTKPGQNAVVVVQQGGRWAPAVLGVAGADGRVPEIARSSLTGGNGGDGLPVRDIVLGALALGAAATVVLRLRRRRAVAIPSTAS